MNWVLESLLCPTIYRLYTVRSCSGVKSRARMGSAVAMNEVGLDMDLRNKSLSTFYKWIIDQENGKNPMYMWNYALRTPSSMLLKQANWPVSEERSHASFEVSGASTSIRWPIFSLFSSEGSGIYPWFDYPWREGVSYDLLAILR